LNSGSSENPSPERPLASLAFQPKPPVAEVLRAAAIEGGIARGKVARLIGMSERTGRDVLRGLLNEGLLVTTSERGPVRLGFPAHAAGYLFPSLYPTEGYMDQTGAAERVMSEDRGALRKLSE
jgi:hypothetical protein